MSGSLVADVLMREIIRAWNVAWNPGATRSRTG
jgi:hypothetical protein